MGWLRIKNPSIGLLPYLMVAVARPTYSYYLIQLFDFDVSEGHRAIIIFRGG
jgi:hypothetical protein